MLPWVVLTNLWFNYRKDLYTIVVVHAATNASILLSATFSAMDQVVCFHFGALFKQPRWCDAPEHLSSGSCFAGSTTHDRFSSE